ncbi:DUF192 domain-containing protein [Chiayiivirga flava]|uniref:DUF192 domain-containing protein n=1 Tax=Chiayiivirga flava TaxID=659595 RepID=A0A7W8D421_9GAMM|nr:DUF192 domain-containing protein [Chiayiivirga flava]MBB5207553.1 hypothetical protein [Chiayiivirga flava]
MALIALAMTALGGCAGATGPWVELGGQRFFVEIADSDEERARGLMFRDTMARDRGMLFLFERQEPQAFWMRNTRIPLDIFYFDAQRRLVSVAAGVPPCTTPRCPSYPSAGPAQYVLELNAGLSRELKTVAGDAITFSPDIDAQLAGSLDSR